MRYEILIGLLATAASIIIGACLGSRQIQRAIEAIHADIKASQEKLERKIQERGRKRPT